VNANLLDPDRHWLESIDAKVSALSDGNQLYTSILDWLERNMVFPLSDRSRVFKRETAPYFNQIFTAIESGKYKVVSVLGPTGSGKTSFEESLIA